MEHWPVNGKANKQTPIASTRETNRQVLHRPPCFHSKPFVQPALRRLASWTPRGSVLERTVSPAGAMTSTSKTACKQRWELFIGVWGPSSVARESRGKAVFAHCSGLPCWLPSHSGPAAPQLSRPTLNAGSSKHGNARRAEAASNWVVASERCLPSASVYVLLRAASQWERPRGGQAHPKPG